jgi:hypothetical protein
MSLPIPIKFLQISSCDLRVINILCEFVLCCDRVAAYVTIPANLLTKYVNMRLA